MKLVRLDAQHFKGWAGHQVLRFSEGPQWILGDNGTGKTSVADAIAFVLWGCDRWGAFAADAFIHTDATQCEVTLTVVPPRATTPVRLTRTRRVGQAGGFYLNDMPIRSVEWLPDKALGLVALWPSALLTKSPQKAREIVLLAAPPPDRPTLLASLPEEVRDRLVAGSPLAETPPRPLADIAAEIREAGKAGEQHRRELQAQLRVLRQRDAELVERLNTAAPWTDALQSQWVQAEAVVNHPLDPMWTAAQQEKAIQVGVLRARVEELTAQQADPTLIASVTARLRGVTEELRVITESLDAQAQAQERASQWLHAHRSARDAAGLRASWQTDRQATVAAIQVLEHEGRALDDQLARNDELAELVQGLQTRELRMRQAAANQGLTDVHWQLALAGSQGEDRAAFNVMWRRMPLAYCSQSERWRALAEIGQWAQHLTGPFPLFLDDSESVLAWTPPAAPGQMLLARAEAGPLRVEPWRSPHERQP